MNTIELKAENRTTKGNGPARALRRSGRVPAVLYGPSREPNMLSLIRRDLDDILKQGGMGRTILNIVLDDGKTTKPAMIKELQTHPVSSDILHVDLYEIAMDRKIRVSVPVTTTGKSIGVEQGGMLQLIRRELEVFCLPNEIPGTISIDITNLDIGDAIHVEEIPLAGNVEIPHEVNFTVLTVTSRKAETVEAEEEEEEVAEAEAEGDTEE